MSKTSCAVGGAGSNAGNGANGTDGAAGAAAGTRLAAGAPQTFYPAPAKTGHVVVWRRTAAGFVQEDYLEASNAQGGNELGAARLAGIQRQKEEWARQSVLSFAMGRSALALKSFAECPNCRARLEFSVDVNELRDGFASFSNAANADPAELTVGDIRIQFRRLNTADLTAAARCADVNAARSVLLQRCVVEARRDGAPLAAADLPAACVEALSSRLAALDGAADIALDLRCVACAHAWPLTLDIVRFLWAEVNALAKAYLNDVHMLAWAYGWREADILAMSAARRQFYLERVG